MKQISKHTAALWCLPPHCDEIPFAIYCLQKSFDHIITSRQEEDSIEEEIVS